MYLDTDMKGERLRAAIPVIAVHAMLAFILLRGLNGAMPERENGTLRLVPVPPLVTIVEPAPPPPPSAERAAPDALRLAPLRPEGAASPPNLKAEPSPFVAPEPVIRPPIQPPPTVTPAPVAGTGAAPNAGAAPIRGPGTGSGGIGNGRGSGLGGDGTGGGGGGGGDGSGIVARPPRWTCCNLSIRDVPRDVQERVRPGVSIVSILYVVEADGRVTNCRVARSSGNRELDQLTCRLVERRYRFRPALNPAGRPVRAVGVGDDHEWMFEQEREYPRDRRPERGW